MHFEAEDLNSQLSCADTLWWIQSLCLLALYHSFTNPWFLLRYDLQTIFAPLSLTFDSLPVIFTVCFFHLSFKYQLIPICHILYQILRCIIHSTLIILAWHYWYNILNIVDFDLINDRQIPIWFPIF